MKNTDKNMDFSAIYAIISEKKGIFHHYCPVKITGVN